MNKIEIPKKFNSPYNPQNEETRIYEIWEKSGYFNPDNLPERHKKPYCTIMPPPNANGRLHAGHGLDMTLKDIAVRYHRMAGKKTLFLPGADHAGFETQMVFEKKMSKEGRSRFHMTNDELYKEIWNFTMENKQFMESDIRRLGTSCDWSRKKFTLDEEIVKKVQDTFIKMYKDGLVYRGERIVNWNPKFQTSLSDIETEFVEQTDPFYYFQYGPFVIGTVRPETKFGDKYVVMHPDDKRYAEYTHGQKIDLEWINGPITATVIKDESIDMEFGTGVMTITPWHSNVDFEIAERHGLDKEQIIDWNGKLLPIAGEFAGMKILEARPKIVEKLKAKGLLVKVDEKYVHAVSICERTGVPIEPQIKKQWFVKMKPLADMVINSVEKKNQINILPDHQKKILLHWMHNTIDWNISRQIVWGIPIPAWFKDNEVQVSHEAPGPDWKKDPDTFDTWFSSGQWPLLVLGYPDGADFKEYYPTDLMETGSDLVFKWIPRMIMFGIYLGGKIPFENIYFHGMVNDANNQKMSKSKGNVVSPVEVSDKFGTDALRMALVIGNPPGGSIPLADGKIKGYKHFANKIWNITRFVLMSLDDFDLNSKPKLSGKDQKYLAELDSVVTEVTKNIEELRFDLGADKIYHYIWHTFADVILEDSKKFLNSTNEEAKKSTQYMLYKILTTSLKLLHPFMPFVTEAIWENIPTGSLKETDLLMIEKWPSKKFNLFSFISEKLKIKRLDNNHFAG
jgi:valyl-tRNA synthetase